MNKKSFIFLILAIIFFVVVVLYYYFYTNIGNKSIVNTIIDNNKTERSKPTIRELEKAAEEVRDTTPMTPEKIKELEKAAEEVSALPDNTNLKNAADQMVAFDKEREKNRAALLRAAEGINN